MLPLPVPVKPITPDLSNRHLISERPANKYESHTPSQLRPIRSWLCARLASMLSTCGAIFIQFS